MDLKTLGTLSVELDMDPVLEHRDMTALIQRNSFKKFTTITASSTLSAQGRNTYGVDNLQDGDLNTAWCEGAKGNGVGRVADGSHSQSGLCEQGPLLWALAVSPGYAKSGVLDRQWAHFVIEGGEDVAILRFRSAHCRSTTMPSPFN